ncbi:MULTISPECIES: phage tail protein I [Pontibacillus]|uniref:Phage tail protein I n=1 Tax=Pontibacillus chungwhensis TaxID=265426 RepID=A0ABY8UYK4_9BACI|nr:MULTISPECIES: phage tail protein I [Pontibacillus]MCD5324786.1 phage tail protein I [Pontibacillus sp. HN14]WIF98745.1 phage tail protein I [Pontibacillus chungwhensis]
MIDLQTFTLAGLLPSSLKDEDTASLASAFDKELRRVITRIPKTIIENNLMDLEEPLLDVLAWEKHVDFYEPELSIETKRQLIKDSEMLHKYKGTPWAVERLVSTVFEKGAVKEWFEYGGDPYHFKVEIEGAFSAEKDIDRLGKLIQKAKNIRSKFEGFSINMPKSIITLKEASHFFKVPYKITNRFHTDDRQGTGISSPLNFENKPYYFPVNYPVCGTFKTASVKEKSTSFLSTGQVLSVYEEVNQWPYNPY